MSASTIRDRFLQQPDEPEEDLETQDDPAPDPDSYQAFAKGKQGRRGELGMMLYYEDGQSVEVLYYSYLMRALAISPQVLHLMCTDCVYTLTGNNLLPLLPLLRDNKILFLQAFNPQKHPAPPADNDEMLISSIIMDSNETFWEQYQQRQAIREKQDA